MPTYELVVRRKDPLERTHIAAESAAAAAKAGITALGGLGAVEFVSCEPVPEDTLDQAIQRLQDVADAEEATPS